MINKILFLNFKYKGNWDSIYDAIISKEKMGILVDESKTKNRNYTFITEDNYPDKLKDIWMPPFFIFHKGDINLIETEVFSINGNIQLNEFKQLLNDENVKNNTFCINCDQLTNKMLDLVVQNNKKIIVICEGGIDKFKFDDNYENLLLISEYNDSKTYDKAREQTIERLIFAISDKIYIADSNYEMISNLLCNLEFKTKEIYCNNNLIIDLDKLQYDKLKVKYLKNINNAI